MSITGDDVMVNRVMADPEEGSVTAGPSGDINHDPDGGSGTTTTAGVIINRKKGSATSLMMEKLKKNIRNSRSDLNPDEDEEAIVILKREEQACNKSTNNNDPQSSSVSKLLTPESRMQIRHMVRDFGTCSLLIVSGLVVIYDTDHTFKISNYADAILAMFAVTLLYVTIYPKMKESGYILLQTIPKHIDVIQLKQSLMTEFKDSVLSIHDLHVWCLTSTQIIATCHVTIKRSRMSSYGQISRSMEKFFLREGITSATIQPEFCEESERIQSSYPCLYMCSNTETDCQELKCCHETSDECEAVISSSSATAT